MTLQCNFVSHWLSPYPERSKILKLGQTCFAISSFISIITSAGESVHLIYTCGAIHARITRAFISICNIKVLHVSFQSCMKYFLLFWKWYVNRTLALLFVCFHLYQRTCLHLHIYNINHCWLWMSHCMHLSKDQQLFVKHNFYIPFTEISMLLNTSLSSVWYKSIIFVTLICISMYTCFAVGAFISSITSAWVLVHLIYTSGAIHARITCTFISV